MKRLLIFLLLLPSLAWGGETQIARMNPYILGGGVAAGLTCTNGSGDSSIVSYKTQTQNTGAISTTAWKGISFTVSATTLVTKYIVMVLDGAPSDTGNTICDIREDSSDDPGGTAVSGTEVTVAATSYSADAPGTAVDFVLSSPVSLSTGTYHIVCRADGANGDFLRYDANHGNASSKFHYSSNSGSSWSEDTGADGYFEVYGCQ